MRVKEESAKAGSKLNIEKTKIMASGLINTWQIDEGKSGNTDRFYFLGLQTVTTAMKLKDACSLEEKLSHT